MSELSRDDAKLIASFAANVGVLFAFAEESNLKVNLMYEDGVYLLDVRGKYIGMNITGGCIHCVMNEFREKIADFMKSDKAREN